MNRKVVFALLAIIAAILYFNGCKKDDDNQDEVDDQIIQDYLESNDLEATKHESGIYYIITTPGTGIQPNSGSTVSVNYKGYLTDGTVFDETDGTPATFELYTLIEGWQIGIPMLKEGGKGTFFIPSGLGYGGGQIGNIPANSVLIFEIELVGVF